MNRLDFVCENPCGVHIEPTKIDLDPCVQRQLNEHLMLFSPPNGAGRDAETILSSFRDDAAFRSSCLVLVSKFESVLKQQRWSSIPRLINEHFNLKCGAFSGYWPEGLQRVQGEGVGMKLCGAGGTGHLLVSCPRRERKRIGKVAAESWGQELPFRLVGYGSEKVYLEE